ELKLRGGWGQMGSQRNVPTTNAYSFYTANINSTAYDINGNNGAVAIGYRPAVVGNPGTKWETATMFNIGVDASLFDDKLNFTIEYFDNTTEDLLVGRQRNGLAPVATQPLINVGTMSNKGIDAQVSTRGDIGSTGLSYDVAFNFTHYKNKAE